MRKLLSNWKVNIKQKEQCLRKGCYCLLSYEKLEILKSKEEAKIERESLNQ